MKKYLENVVIINANTIIQNFNSNLYVFSRAMCYMQIFMDYKYDFKIMIMKAAQIIII